MGQVTVYADAHVSGSFQNPNNAIGNTPTTWAGQLNVNSNYSSEWSMVNLGNLLTPGATQTVNVSAKKGTNSGTPTISLVLRENGSVVATILSDTGVTSLIGQTLTATFNSSLITNPDNVSIEVVQVSAGGSPSARNSAQIAYIQWVANVDNEPKNTGGGSGGGISVIGAGAGLAQPLKLAQGGSFGAISVTGAGSGKKNVVGVGSGGAISITGAGQGGVYKAAQGGSGGSISITGTGSGQRRIVGSSFGQITIQPAGAGVGISPLKFLTKNIKRNGVLVSATVYKKASGSLIQTGGQTR